MGSEDKGHRGRLQWIQWKPERQPSWATGLYARQSCEDNRGDPAGGRRTGDLQGRPKYYPDQYTYDRASDRAPCIKHRRERKSTVVADRTELDHEIMSPGEGLEVARETHETGEPNGTRDGSHVGPHGNRK